MKSIKLFVILASIVCIGLPIALSTISSAQQAVSIKAVSVQLLETRPPVGNRIINVYRISVVLQNTGDVTSDDITVKFYDPEYNASSTPPLILSPLNATSNVTLNATIRPNEDKVFQFAEWPTPLSGDVPLNITFAPSLPNVIPTEFNSGYYLYTLRIAAPTTKPSTPGFEVGFVFIALAVLLLSRKIKK